MILAASFIVWDLGLMAGTAKVQRRVDEQIKILHGLGALNGDLEALATAHRSELSGQGRTWQAQLAAAKARMEMELGQQPEGQPLARLRLQLTKDLADCDSLHGQARSAKAGTPEAAMADAVFGIMLQRAHGHVDNAVRIIRQDGLGKQTIALSGKWNEGQWLLGLASLFALVCAALVAYVSQLLSRSQERSELLARTGEELERSNRELRETMLSKEEKEVMLKEIHHRVKNNLQIVRSLIRFQTDKVSDPRTMELFNECVNRVGAMALVHEQTYMSKDLANIEVGNYLNSLVRDLAGAYNIRLKLRMDVDIRVKTLGVDTITPLGLLLNEVISNSFKHAFKGREEGTIIVHLDGTEEGGLVLRVGDDGTGLPDHGRWKKPNSLGMELIQTLAGQLNATMELLPGPGMVYELRTTPEQEVRRRA